MEKWASVIRIRKDNLGKPTINENDDFIWEHSIDGCELDVHPLSVEPPIYVANEHESENDDAVDDLSTMG